MWECLSIVSAEAVDRIRALGSATAIAISHPHFYSAMIDWSEALGGVPIYIHANDAEWVRRPSPHIRLFAGESLELAGDIKLILLGGHFPGAPGCGGVQVPGPAAVCFLAMPSKW